MAIFERTKDNLTIKKVKYLDPENKPIPIELKQILNDRNLDVEQLGVERQKYSNCAPKVIEGFVLCLIGENLSQEDAIPFHSRLVETELFKSADQMFDCYL